MKRIISLFVLVLFLFSFSIYAEEGPVGNSDVSSSLEIVLSDALSTAQFTKLRIYLKTAKAEDVTFVENAIIDAARSQKDKGEYGLASDLVGIVLENNLDNENARLVMVEITDAAAQKAKRDAIQREIEAEKAREEAKRLEVERLAREKTEAEAKVIANIETDRLAAEKAKAEREEAARIETERKKSEAAELTARNRNNALTLKGYSAMLDASPLAFYGGKSTFSDLGFGMKYGFRLGLDGRADCNVVRFAGQASCDFTPFAFDGTESRMSVTARASATYAPLGFPLYLSVGYRYAAFGSPSGNTGPSVAYDAIKCATVGLSIERFPFAPGMDASFRAAWIPLNIFDDQVRFAGDFDLSFRYRIMNLKDKLSLYASAGSVTTVIVAAGGSEVGELLYASIGVALNE